MLLKNIKAYIQIPICADYFDHQGGYNKQVFPPFFKFHTIVMIDVDDDNDVEKNCCWSQLRMGITCMRKFCLQQFWPHWSGNTCPFIVRRITIVCTY